MYRQAIKCEEYFLRTGFLIGSAVFYLLCLQPPPSENKRNILHHKIVKI